MEVAERIQLSI